MGDALKDTNSKVENRLDRIGKLGLFWNQGYDSFVNGDFNIGMTEVKTFSDEAFDNLLAKIKLEMERRGVLPVNEPKVIPLNKKVETTTVAAPEKKVSIFGAAKVKPATKAAAKDDKIVVQIPGLEEKLLKLQTLKAEIADGEAMLSAITDEVKGLAKDEFVRLYKENKTNPNTFLIKDGNGCCMILPMDKYLIVKDEARANQLIDEYGKEVVTVDEKYYFNPEVLERNQDVIEELISNSTAISDSDKENMLKKEVKYSIAKGMIDELYHFGNKMENAIADIQPIFMLKNCGGKAEEGGVINSGDLIDDVPVKLGYSLCCFAPVYGDAGICSHCGEKCTVISEDDVKNEIAEVANEEGSEENEQRWENRSYFEGGETESWSDEMKDKYPVATDSYDVPNISDRWGYAGGGNVAAGKVWEVSMIMNPIVPSELKNPKHLVRIFHLGSASEKFDVEQQIAREGLNVREILSITEIANSNEWEDFTYMKKTGKGIAVKSKADALKNYPNLLKNNLVSFGGGKNGYNIAITDKGEKPYYAHGGVAIAQKEFEISIGDNVYWGNYHYEGNKLFMDSCETMDEKGNTVDVYEKGDIATQDKVYSKLEDDTKDEVMGSFDYEYATGGVVGEKYKLGDFVFARLYKDQSIKTPFIVSHWSHDAYYIIGDGSHYVKEEKLEPATAKDFDDYYGEGKANEYVRALNTDEFGKPYEMGGNAAPGEWVVYNDETDTLIGKPHSNRAAAKRAMNDLFKTGKYSAIGMETKAEWDSTHKHISSIDDIVKEDEDNDDALLEHYAFERYAQGGEAAKERTNDVSIHFSRNTMEDMRNAGFTFENKGNCPLFYKGEEVGFIANFNGIQINDSHLHELVPMFDDFRGAIVWNYAGWKSKNRKWMEIKNDFTDDEGVTHIDAFLTEDDNEEGKVIATIDKEGNVTYIDGDAKTDQYAQEMIKEITDQKFATGGDIGKKVELESLLNEQKEIYDWMEKHVHPSQYATWSSTAELMSKEWTVKEERLKEVIAAIESITGISRFSKAYSKRVGEILGREYKLADGGKLEHRKEIIFKAQTKEDADKLDELLQPKYGHYWFAERDGLNFYFPAKQHPVLVSDVDSIEKGVTNDIINKHDIGGHWESFEAGGKVANKKAKTIEDVTELMPEVVAEIVAEGALKEKHEWYERKMAETDNKGKRIFPNLKNPITAENLHSEIEWWADYLVKRAEHLFQVNDRFKKSISAKDELGRDNLYMWMQHWMGIQDSRVFSNSKSEKDIDKSTYANKKDAQRWLDSLEEQPRK